VHCFLRLQDLQRTGKTVKGKGSGPKPREAIDILKTIYQITIITPYSKLKESRLYLPNTEQQNLLKLFNI
jgi:hypothetical protein